MPAVEDWEKKVEKHSLSRNFLSMSMFNYFLDNFYFPLSFPFYSLTVLQFMTYFTSILVSPAASRMYDGQSMMDDQSELHGNGRCLIDVLSHKCF
jgi:hypothetical protein